MNVKLICYWILNSMHKRRMNAYSVYIHTCYSFVTHLGVVLLRRLRTYHIHMYTCKNTMHMIFNNLKPINDLLIPSHPNMSIPRYLSQPYERRMFCEIAFMYVRHTAVLVYSVCISS